MGQQIVVGGLCDLTTAAAHPVRVTRAIVASRVPKRSGHGVAWVARACVGMLLLAGFLAIAAASASSAFAVSQPDWNSAAYRGANWFYNNDYAPAQFYPNGVSLRLGAAKGNCTWYAHGRVRELGYVGTALDSLIKSAGTWASTASANKLFDVDTTPRFGDVAESGGHVAVVEEVNASARTMVISESSYYYPSGTTQGSFLYKVRSDVPFSDFTNYIHVFAGTPPKPPPPTPPAPKVGPATSMVIDVSGSMDESFQGQRKIDKAKEAAKLLVRFVKDQSALTRADGKLSVTAFSTDARRQQNMTLDYAKVVAAIDKLQAEDSTNLSAGIEDGLYALQYAKTTYPKTMIILSDGMANEGIWQPDAIIAGPVARAKKLGVRIFTIGFGDAGSIDELLLERIATSTGGRYALADATKFKTDLGNLFISAQVSSTATVIAQFQGTVAQGKTTAMGTFTVPRNSGGLQAVLNWPGSKLRLNLTDPSGTRVQAGYPGYRTSGKHPILVAIRNATPGIWKASVYGQQVSQPKEPFFSIVAVDKLPKAPTPVPTPTAVPTSAPTPTPSASPSASPSAKPSTKPSPKATRTPTPQASGAMLVAGGGGGGGMGGGVMLVVVVLAAGALIAGLIVRERQGGAPGGGALVLVGVDGREHVIHDGANSVGREYGNDVLLDDPSVSRRHATVEMASGEVDLRDRGSTYGTQVNGLRVSARRLSIGDEIAFGAERLWLREAGDRWPV